MGQSKFCLQMLNFPIQFTTCQAKLTKALPHGKDSARLPRDTVQHPTAAAETKQIKGKITKDE